MFSFAYIDAGSGTLLAQLLVGGLAGVATFAKYRWHTIRKFFQRTAEADQD